MTTVTSASFNQVTTQANKTVSASSLWFKDGWQLFKQAPIKIFSVMTLFAILPGLLQLLPSPFGLMLSKWVGPMLLGVVCLILNNLFCGRGFSVRSQSVGYTSILKQWGRFALWSLSGVLLASIQFQVGSILIGSDNMSASLMGDYTNVALWQAGVIFASTTPIAMLLSFVPMLLILQGQSLYRAFRQSVFCVIRAWKPMSVLMLLSIIVVFSVPYTGALSALLVGPYMTCVTFIAYKQLFKDSQSPNDID